jgi:hypothetical protein
MVTVHAAGKGGVDRVLLFEPARNPLRAGRLDAMSAVRRNARFSGTGLV